MSAERRLRQWKPYPAYKDSGVEWLGEVPEGWEVISLRRLFHVKSGDMTSPSEFIDEGYQVYGGNGFRGFIDKWNTQEGTIIIGRYGALCGNIKIAPCNLWATEHAFRVFSFLQFDTSFMAYLLVDLNLNRLSARAAQPGLNSELVRDHTLGIPNVSEQKAIASFLDHQCARIDALIEKKRRLLELLEEKRRAVITQAVTRGLDPDAPMKDSGVEWLGQVPKGWEVKKFKYCATVANGQVDPTEPPHNDKVLIAPDHLSKNTGQILERFSAHEQGAISGKYQTRPGQIIYSKIRPALNKLCISEGDWLCSADMYPISPEQNFITSYLFYLMLSDAFTVCTALISMRVAMPKINREQLGVIPLVAPPIPEQQAITDYLDAVTAAIDAQRKAHEKSITLLQEYRASLITHAVTGKIDVNDYAPQP